MRNVESHLLGDKMDEVVTHYINTHQPSEHVHIDTDGMPMAVQDDGSRISVMHPHTYSSHLCRQVSGSEPVGDGPWSEELLDTEGRIAAIVAQLAQNSRSSHHSAHPHPHHKVPVVRNEVDTSVILDSSIRFNGQTLDQQSVSLAGLPPMQSLPPLQDMKRCETDWFSDKNKKNEAQIGQLTDSDGPVLELAGGSPAQSRQQSRKSLPHKKRISRKLKRNNGSSTPQQDLVVINNIEPAVTPVVEEEQILPDNFVTVQQQSHHMSHEVRPILICQICGDFYGEEQLKFFHHLKQHYEPHSTIIIDNPVSDLVMDKMTNTCIVDNVAALPDSIVELSLENTVPKTMYQPIDKHSALPLSYNSIKVQYSMASMDKEPVPVEGEKTDLYETLDKLELYNCGKCSKTFRKQKQCEAHMREAHPSTTKCEDMGEFSEPEDLMAGIHVCVGEYESPLLPHLTVDNGHVHQDHTRHWYARNGTHDPCEGCNDCNNDNYCAGCDRDPEPTHPTHTTHDTHTTHSTHTAHTHTAHDTQPSHVPHVSHTSHVTEAQHASHSQHVTHATHPRSHGPSHLQHEPQPLKVLKEEVLQRIFESEVPTPLSYNAMIHDQHEHDQHEHDQHEHDQHEHGHEQKNIVNQKIKLELEPKTNGKRKRLECSECARVFTHRNSLMYHMLSHAARQHACALCPKTFLTPGALKIHKRVHNGDKPYKCELCGRDFRQWSDLKYHTISLHSNEKSFKCEFCGKEFARKYSLNVHRRIHTGERNYKCDYCSKTFSASSYRLTHMRTHTGDRPYKCDECGKCFRCAFDLRRHLLVHDKIRNRFDEQKPKPKEKKIKLEKDKVQIPSEPKSKLIKPTAPKHTIKKSPKKKSPTNKKGAPNVTVQNRDGLFKINEYPNSEEFERPQFTKFKIVYSDSEFNKETSQSPYKAQLYRESDRDGFAVLKPLLRSEYRENTDGKLQIFTHVEKSKEYNGSIVSNSQVLGDIRHLERDVAREVRSDGNINVMENAFLERLTALYNVPA